MTISAAIKKTTLDQKIQGTAYEVAKICSDHKGFNIRICDLDQHCSYASYFVFVSCSSTRQTGAIADAIISSFHLPSTKVEGKSLGDWVLIDLGDIVVHVFEQGTRDFYMLDRTWGHVPSHLYIDENEKSLAVSPTL